MKELSRANLTLAAVVASCFIQIGAQLYALVVVAGTVAKAPPRSFAMFEGEYGYDSSAFWNTVPPDHFYPVARRSDRELENRPSKASRVGAGYVPHRQSPGGVPC